MAFGRRRGPSGPSPADQLAATPSPQLKITAAPISSLGPAVPDDLGPCNDAASELIDMLMDAYRDGGNRIHAETIIGAAAALTGEFALRSTGLPLPNEGFVFGDAINGVLFEDEGRATVWHMLKAAAENARVAEWQLPDIPDIVRRVVERITHIQATGKMAAGFRPSPFRVRTIPTNGRRMPARVCAIT